MGCPRVTASRPAATSTASPTDAAAADIATASSADAAAGAALDTTTARHFTLSSTWAAAPQQKRVIKGVQPHSVQPPRFGEGVGEVAVEGVGGRTTDAARFSARAAQLHGATVRRPHADRPHAVVADLDE